MGRTKKKKKYSYFYRMKGVVLYQIKQTSFFSVTALPYNHCCLFINFISFNTALPYYHYCFLSILFYINISSTNTQGQEAQLRKSKYLNTFH